MLGDNDGNADVDVGQQTQILIVDEAGDFTDIPVAARLHGRGNRVDDPDPGAPRYGIPCNLDSLYGLQTSHVGFVDESPHQYFREIGFLKKQVSGLNKGPDFYRKGVDDSVERRADTGLAESGFSAVVRGLGPGGLSLCAGDLRLREALFLFLLEKIQVGLRALQSHFRLPDFSRGGRSLL